MMQDIKSRRARKGTKGSSMSILNNTALTYSKLTNKKIKNKGLNSILNSQITI
jgi:hypothetical protein